MWRNVYRGERCGVGAFCAECGLCVRRGDRRGGGKAVRTGQASSGAGRRAGRTMARRRHVRKRLRNRRLQDAARRTCRSVPEAAETGRHGVQEAQGSGSAERAFSGGVSCSKDGQAGKADRFRRACGEPLGDIHQQRNQRHRRCGESLCRGISCGGGESACEGEKFWRSVPQGGEKRPAWMRWKSPAEEDVRTERGKALLKVSAGEEGGGEPALFKSTFPLSGAVRSAETMRCIQNVLEAMRKGDAAYSGENGAVVSERRSSSGGVF